MNCKQLPVHPINDKTEEVEEMGYQYCVEAIKRRHPKGDLLEALIQLEALHEAAVYATWTDQDPDGEKYDEFLWDYCYEIAYFNLICREMAPLFAKKEAA